MMSSIGNNIRNYSCTSLMTSAELFLPCAVCSLGINHLCAPAGGEGSLQAVLGPVLPTAASPTAPRGCDPTACAGTGGTQSFPGGTGTSPLHHCDPVSTGTRAGPCWGRVRSTGLAQAGALRMMAGAALDMGQQGGNSSSTTALNSLWKSKAGKWGIIQMKEKATSSFST